jgi:hypothetical protein
MKTRFVCCIVLVFLALSPQKGFATNIQSNIVEWAPKGTKWYYDYKAPFAFGYILMESEKDTLINGKNCRMLTLSEHSYTSPGVYIHAPYDTIITLQEGSKIYIHQRNKFSLLFDFDPTIGDIWDLNGASIFREDSISCEGGKVIVDSVKQVIIDGQQLNEVFSSPYMGSLIRYGGSIVEGIGCLWGLYPSSSHPCSPVIDYGETFQLRCFYSAKMDTTFINTECDYITTLEEVDIKKTLQLIPNPARDKLKIKCETNAMCYPVVAHIFTLTGTKCFSLNLTETDEINITGLAPGLYFLKIYDSKSTIFQVKFMKN